MQEHFVVCLFALCDVYLFDFCSGLRFVEAFQRVKRASDAETLCHTGHSEQYLRLVFRAEV